MRPNGTMEKITLAGLSWLSRTANVISMLCELLLRGVQRGRGPRDKYTSRKCGSFQEEYDQLIYRQSFLNTKSPLVFRRVRRRLQFTISIKCRDYQRQGEASPHLKNIHCVHVQQLANVHKKEKLCLIMGQRMPTSRCDMQDASRCGKTGVSKPGDCRL